MDSDAKARITQMENIRKKTGKNIDELAKAAAARGLEKHTAMRDFFKTEYGLGYGDANMLAFVIRDPDIDTAPAQPQKRGRCLERDLSGEKKRSCAPCMMR